MSVVKWTRKTPPRQCSVESFHYNIQHPYIHYALYIIIVLVIVIVTYEPYYYIISINKCAGAWYLLHHTLFFGSPRTDTAAVGAGRYYYYYYTGCPWRIYYNFNYWSVYNPDIVIILSDRFELLLADIQSYNQASMPR